MRRVSDGYQGAGAKKWQGEGNYGGRSDSPSRTGQPQARLSEGPCTPPLRSPSFFQPSFSIIHLKLAPSKLPVPPPAPPQARNHQPFSWVGLPFTPEALWSWSPPPATPVPLLSRAKISGAFSKPLPKEPHSVSPKHPQLQSSYPQSWEWEGPRQSMADSGVSVSATQAWGGPRSLGRPDLPTNANGS